MAGQRVRDVVGRLMPWSLRSEGTVSLPVHEAGAQGHWVTLHGPQGHGGTHIYIEQGRVTKGPPALRGQQAGRALAGQTITSHPPGHDPTAAPQPLEPQPHAAAPQPVAPVPPIAHEPDPAAWAATMSVGRAEMARHPGGPLDTDAARAAKADVMRTLGAQLQRAGVSAQQATDFTQRLRAARKDVWAAAEQGVHGDTPHEQAADAVLAGWADTSNESASALAMQRLASREFGLGEFGPQQSHVTNSLRWDAAYALADHPDFELVGRTLLRAMYNTTQQRFKDLGVTHLALSRGVTDVTTPAIVQQCQETAQQVGQDEEGDYRPWQAQGTTSVRMNPLSSFALDPHDAFFFGGQAPDPTAPAVNFVGTVPAERVLSLWSTGLGCRGESEAVVLGGAAQMRWLAGGGHTFGRLSRVLLDMAQGQQHVREDAGDDENADDVVDLDGTPQNADWPKVNQARKGVSTPEARAGARLPAVREDAQIEDQPNRDYGDPPLLRSQLPNPDEPEVSDTGGDEDDEQDAPVQEAGESAGHWVTLHDSGTHLYIEGGAVTKGPPDLLGKRADEAVSGRRITHHPPGYAPSPLGHLIATHPRIPSQFTDDYGRPRPVAAMSQRIEDHLRQAGHLDEQHTPTFLGAGDTSAVFDLGHEKVARLQTTTQADRRPHEPWMVQPHLQGRAGYLNYEVLPKVELVDKTRFTNDPAYMDRVIRAMQSLRQQTRDSGWDFPDEKEENIGWLQGRPVILDPGAVRRRHDVRAEAPVQEVADDGDGHWITLKKGPLSTHVYVNAHGVITKGPASLIQHGLSHLPPPPELDQEHHAPGQVPAGATEHPAYADRGAALAGEFIAWQGQSALPDHLAQALQPAGGAAVVPPGQSTRQGAGTRAPAAARPTAPSAQLPALGSSPLGDVQAPTDPAVWPASHTFFKAEEQRYGTAEHAWYATRQSVGTMLAQAGISTEQAQHLNQHLHAASELYPRGEPTPHEELADRCMTGWAASGAADPVYQVLQTLAAQEFGLGPYDERHTYVKHQSVWDAVQRVLDDPEAVRTGRSVLRAIYDHTQAHLQAHGLEHVALFRGVQNVTTPSVVNAVQQARHAAGAAQSAYQYDEPWMADGTAQTHLWPLSSFTFDPNIGQEYSGADLGYKNRSRDSADAVLAAQVPRQRVLSLWTTGLGNGGEAEAVVLGGPAQVRWVAGQEGRRKEMRDALRAAAQGAPIREAAQDERDNVIDVDGTPENAEWLRRLSALRPGRGEDQTAGQPTNPPEEPVQEADDDDGADGHWVTLKSLGLTSHVFVNPHGVITKGPSQLTGHAVGHLPAAPHVEQEHHPGGVEPQGARDQANYSAERVGGATQPWKGAALAGAHLALAGAYNRTAAAQREQEAKKEAQGGYWGSFHLRGERHDQLRGERHDQVGVFLNNKGTITKGPESLVGANMFDLLQQDRLAGHPGAELSNEEEPDEPRGMTEHPTYVDKHDEIGQGEATKSPAEGLLGLERAFYEHQRGQGALQDSPLYDRQNFERHLGQLYGLDTTDEALRAAARTPISAQSSALVASATQDTDAREQATTAHEGDPMVSAKIRVMKDIGTRLAPALSAEDCRYAIRELRGQDPDDYTGEHENHPQRYHYGLARALTELWAISSSDTHAAPLSTQLIAAQHFGIDTWDHHDEDTPPPTCKDPTEWRAARAMAADPRYSRCVKAYLTAMYQNTQERLRAQGTTHLALCRGTQDWATPAQLDACVAAAQAQYDKAAAGGFSGDDVDDWQASGTTPTTLNPLSSFALSAEVAARPDFGGGTSYAQMEGGQANIHFVGAVPAQRVLSLYTTGFGCRDEHEAVVLGGPAEMHWIASGNSGRVQPMLDALQWGGQPAAAVQEAAPTVANDAPFNLDATIENADWLKRTWDLQGDAKEQLQTIVGNAKTLGARRQRVRQFLQTPAAFAMPPKLRKLLAARGYLPQEAREADTDAGGHWITMHMGPMRTHVFINERGVITKGPASLTGHSMDHLPNKLASKEHHPWGHEPPGAQQHPDYNDVSGTLGQQGHAPQPYNEGVQHLMQALTTAPPPTEPVTPWPRTEDSTVPASPVLRPTNDALAKSAAQSVITPDLSWNDGSRTHKLQEEEYNNVPQMGDPAVETKIRVMTDLGRRMAAGVSVDDCKEIMQEFGYDPDEMPAGLRGHPHRYHFGAARALTERWAVSSSDTHADALAIQVLADQHFGIGAFAAHTDPDTPPAVCKDPQAWRHALYYTSQGSFQRAVTGFLDAMYQHTQEHLQKKGITHLALCRGTVDWATPEQVETCKRSVEEHLRTVDDPEWSDNAEQWTAGGTADVDLHPLSSFSTKAQIAADFGGYTSHGQLKYEHSANIHYVGKVPAARILSLFTTGFGCREELEAVVLGGPTRMHWAAGGRDWLVQRKLENMQEGAAPWEAVQEAEVTPGTRLHLDATIVNADWTKKTWDLHGTPQEQVQAIVGRAKTVDERRALADAFLRTPAAQSMPAEVRTALQAEGARPSENGQAPPEPNAGVHEADKPQDDDPTGRWVTMHGQAVFITHDGTIKKGPPLLKGIKLPSGMHKKVLDEHDKAEAAKKAQQGATPPGGQQVSLPADTAQQSGKQTKFGKPTKFGKVQGQQGTPPPGDPTKTWGQPDKYGQYPGADMPTWAAGLTKAPDVPPVPPPQLPKQLPPALLEPAETPDGPAWAQRIDLDTLGMMKEVGQAGGHNGARFYEDSQGQRYVTKRPQADRLAMEQYGIAYMHQLGMQAPAAVINPQWRGGMLVQRMVTNLADPPDMKNWTADDFAKNLSTGQATEMARNFVFDWLTGNGDAHRRNFLLTKDGRLIGIDKGQAYKYCGDPRFKLHQPYVSPEGEVSFPHAGKPAPNGHASLPPWTGSKEGLAYAPFFTAVKQGKLKIDMKQLNTFITKIEQTPLDEGTLRVIADLRHQAHWDKYPSGDQLVQTMNQRRMGVRSAMQSFFKAIRADSSALTQGE